jgi:broad specificity phosphatase PhoE
MTKLILIPAGQTDWQAQGRLTGDTDLPLNEDGHRTAIAHGAAIADLRPAAIHCGPENATKQTATIIARELSVKTRTVADLREMDLGHWEGLSRDDFQERFAKVYRQWRTAPGSVQPPEGEAMPDAAGRLRKGVDKIVKRSKDQTVALTLGRFAYAILRCQFDDGSLRRFWDHVDGEPACHVVEHAPQPPTAGPADKAPGPPAG